MKWQVFIKNCEKQGTEYTALRNPMFHMRHVWDATTQNKKTNKHRSASLSDIFFLAFYEKFILKYDLRVLLVIQLILWNPIF